MNKDKKIYLASFFVPFFLFLLVLAILGFYPFGEDLYLLSDLKYQYVDFLANLKSLFYGNTLNYSFNVSLGSNFTGLFSYYLSSPFNILTLIIPNSLLGVFIPIIIALKIGASGLTLTYYLKTRKEKFGYDSLIFSIAYALSGYMICYSLHIMWLDIYILLPLIIVGIDRIVEGKSPKFYIITLVASIVINYYITFMVCIFSIFYVLYKLFVNKMEFRERVNIFKNHVISSLLAVLISMVVLLPVLFSLSGGKSEIAITTNMFTSINKIDYYLKALMTANYSWWESFPNIFVGMLVLLLVILFFFNTKIKFREKIVSGILLFVMILFFANQGLNIIMHGFDYPNSFPYRFSFVFIFVLIMIAYRCFKNINGIKKRDMLIALLFTLFSIYIIFDEYNKYLKLDVLLLIIYTILIYIFIYKKDIKFYKHILTVFLILNIFNLFINARYDIREIKSQDFKSSKEIYDEKYQNTSEVINDIKESDKGLYRIEKTSELNYNFNDAMMFNYNSVTNFNSTNSIKTLDLIDNLGINRYIVTSTYDDGSTRFVDALLGIKYVNTTINGYKGYEEKQKYDNSIVYKNNNSLNFGFISSLDINNFNNDYENTFIYQNELAKKLSGNDFGNIYKKLDYKIDVENLKYKEEKITLPTGEMVDTKLYEKIDKNKNATLVLSFDSNEKNYIYYYIESMKFDQNIEVYINEEEVVEKTSGSPLNSPNPGMFYLGEYEDGEEVEIKFVLNDEESLKYEDMYVYTENEETLNKYLSNINSNGTVDINFNSSSNLEGEASLLNDGYLTFSIPYDKGWKVYINEQKVESTELINGLLGVKLDKGSYSVKLIYSPPGRALGFFLSIFGIFLTVIYLKLYNKKKIDNRKR